VLLLDVTGRAWIVVPATRDQISWHGQKRKRKGTRSSKRRSCSGRDPRGLRFGIVDECATQTELRMLPGDARHLSVAVGTGGSAIRVMAEPDGSFRILTRPVVFSEKVKPLGTLRDIGLFDFSQYAVGLRQDATLDKLQHVGFTRNVVTFRLQLRVDGQTVVNAPYTPPNSGATRAHSPPWPPEESRITCVGSNGVSAVSVSSQTP
jgi:Phage capsid family